MMNYYNLSLTNKLGLAALSGAMVFPISFLLEKVNPLIFADISLSDIIIGVVFAILVMIPNQKKTNWQKSFLMIIASIAIYSSMVYLAVSNYKPFLLDLSLESSITVSGGLGALLTGMTVKLISPLKLRHSVYPLLTIFGLLAGYVFSMTIKSDSYIINSLGFIIWQVLTCFAIAVSKKT